MIGIPNPKKLVEIAHSAERIIQDREWKQYQRYLSKTKQQQLDNPNLVPHSFDEFCALRREKAILRSLENT